MRQSESRVVIFATAPQAVSAQFYTSADERSETQRATLIPDYRPGVVLSMVSSRRSTVRHR